jgi:AcrR family transcriptional regulator
MAHQVGEDSARRAELLEKVVAYARRHGLAGMSLRPLAAAVGSSPRVLLYFFESKEQLVREVIAYNRREQVRLVEGEPAAQAEEAYARLWDWLADPANIQVERLFFETFALSLREEPGAWESYAATSVAEWLPQLRPIAAHLLPHADSEAGATLLLAVLRGLLMDLLATGDSRRTREALNLFTTELDAQ